MFAVPTLRGDGVVLRPWSLSDVAAVRAAAADPYIPQVTTVPVTTSELQARAFIERQWDRARSGLGYSFAVCTSAEAVGQIGLWPREGMASVGYWLVPAARGRGLAARALAVLVEWATANGYPALELYAEPWNEASLATARRCGFVERELVHAHHQVGTEFRDAIHLTRTVGQPSGAMIDDR